MLLDKVQNARANSLVRAFSLVELVAVVAIVGMLATAAAITFGFDATYVSEGEQVAYRVSTALGHARRAAISTGDNHYVQFQRTSGTVTSFDTYRVLSGGDTVVDQSVALPTGVDVTTASDRWEFSFDGSVVGATAVGQIEVTAPGFKWTLVVQHGTGAVRVTKSVDP